MDRAWERMGRARERMDLGSYRVDRASYRVDRASCRVRLAVQRVRETSQSQEAFSFVYSVKGRATGASGSSHHGSQNSQLLRGRMGRLPSSPMAQPPTECPINVCRVD